MRLLQKEVIDRFKFDCVAGSSFVEVDRFLHSGGSEIKFLLVLTPTPTGRSSSIIVILSVPAPDGDGVWWLLNPFMSDEIVTHLCKLAPPSVLQSRIPDDLKVELGIK